MFYLQSRGFWRKALYSSTICKYVDAWITPFKVQIGHVKKIELYPVVILSVSCYITNVQHGLQEYLERELVEQCSSWSMLIFNFSYTSLKCKTVARHAHDTSGKLQIDHRLWSMKKNVELYPVVILSVSCY